MHTRRAKILLLIAIVGAALNMRPAVASVGPLLHDIRDDLHLDGAVAGLLTALPAICFAAFGSLAPRVAAKFGARHVVAGGMLVLAAALLARAVAPNAVTFILFSALALGAIASANVLVPALVRGAFPSRIGPVTGAYTMAMSLGTAAVAAVVVPLSHVFGESWRSGLGIWAVTALLAFVPWLLVRGDVGAHPARLAQRPARQPIRLRSSPTAWGLAFFMGFQSLSAYSTMGWLPQIYRDAGLSDAYAGGLLAITTGIGIPMALLLPAMAARGNDQRVFAIGLTCLIGVGYLGLGVAPATVPWLWAAVIGVGQCCFPLALVMIGLRVRDGAHTAALSGFAQSIGYLIAVAGPIAIGALYDATGGWTVPLAVLAVFLVPQAIGALFAARPRYVDDEVESRTRLVPADVTG